MSELPKQKLRKSSCFSSGFTCHEHGATVLQYAPKHQLLISGGRKGCICLFDIRQRQLIHTFQAHDSAIKALALDPCEEYFTTGSAEGNIKVSWQQRLECSIQYVVFICCQGFLRSKPSNSHHVHANEGIKGSFVEILSPDTFHLGGSSYIVVVGITRQSSLRHFESSIGV